MKDLLTMEELSSEEIMRIISRAIQYKKEGIATSHQGKVVANLFFENSTRTKMSFEMAEFKLGMHSIPFDVSTSSVQKGETLYDTCKTLQAIGCNALVIRHNQNEYYKELIQLDIPIINGGDGSGSHPSQSLLDLMTIYEKFGYFEGLKVVIAGDIVHSRVAKSNQQALTKLGATVYFSGPDEWQDHSIDAPYLNFNDAVRECDVVMLLRVQKERHEISEQLYTQSYNQLYGMNHARYQMMKEHAIIMHPAPVNRGIEIIDELVECEKSVIFEQMTNGVYVRMSILEEVLGE